MSDIERRRAINEAADRVAEYEEKCSRSRESVDEATQAANKAIFAHLGARDALDKAQNHLKTANGVHECNLGKLRAAREHLAILVMEQRRKSDG